MKTSHLIIMCLTVALRGGLPANAQLLVKPSVPKNTETKSVIKLTLKNTFTEKVESARATIFLTDEQGKMVGQATQWVIGGTKDRPGLDPDKETTFNFVIPIDKPFKESRVVFNRIVLAGGKSVDVAKSIQISK